MEKAAVSTTHNQLQNTLVCDLFWLLFQFSVSCQLLFRILTSTIALVPAVRVINESCGVDGSAQFSVSGGTGVGYYINVCTPILIMFSKLIHFDAV